MASEILVTRSPGETRVAVVEDGRLVEFDQERDDHRGVVGNIYAARVGRVLPGMQAAFLDIGLERAAFLYVDDIIAPDVDGDEAEPAVVDAQAEDTRPSETARPPIQELIRTGQELMVQIRKAPFGTKGARVTSYVTIPGRFVVYLPSLDRTGVSRKIVDEDERTRLRSILEAGRAQGEGGFIARTVCEGLQADVIERDMGFVRGLWSEILERAEGHETPSLLQADLDLVLRTARDLFTETTERLVCDDETEANRIRRLVARHAPELSDRIMVHDGPEPLFASRGIEAQIEAASKREVRLSSGGSIVFDEAEALTAVDVNTGRFVGKKDLEQTILRTNLEAAEAVAAQIQLRNLGGIIIIDFIDMQDEANRTRVFEAFSAAMARDRSRNHILPITEFGLVELTRKRVRPSLGRRTTEPCPYCEGRGRITSRETLSLRILREVREAARRHPSGTLMVSAMPEVARFLTESPHLERLESELSRTVRVEARADYHQEVFHISVR